MADNVWIGLSFRMSLNSEDLHLPEIKKDIRSMRKIFMSVIAIGNIYKEPSLEDIMVTIYSNLSRYTDQL